MEVASKRGPWEILEYMGTKRALASSTGDCFQKDNGELPSKNFRSPVYIYI